ncbi:DUF348 domain-containing protein [Bacillus lacus]|uniref:DUF348 domain-containing protein n=1 Tax=Metabacillus lacus TaxID=1983721 RepID=A0A7X2J0D0_9BACI|nr:G5 and 3D domain-containing protein [Metabacillus lacus]MRX72944.1 DUF348 domain-containing protein [Metabacillus lacus]
MKKLFSEKMSKTKLILFAGSLLVVGSGTAYGAHEATKSNVTLSLNGEEQEIRTHASTVNDLLEDLNIEVKKEDALTPSEHEQIQNDMEIVYEAARPVALSVNHEKETIWTTAETVEALLEEQQLAVTEHDKIHPSVDTPLEEKMTIEIEKAFQLTLNVGGKEQQVWATSTTVADFLKEHEVELGDLDKITPNLEHHVTKDDVIAITRVEKVTDVVEEPVSFAVVTKNDNTLSKGKQEVIEQGKKGKLASHYEVILENGKEVSRTLVKKETLSESVNRVVAVGTKQEAPALVKTAAAAPKTVSRSNDSVSKEFYVTSTAYTAFCNGCSGITATGVNLRANPGAKVIAVDPRVIPLGTKVHVEGYGYAIAADTGSAIKGNKIDVFFPDKSTAYRWGNKKVKIKILN